MSITLSIDEKLAEHGVAGGLEQRGIGLEGRVEDPVTALLGEGDDIGKEERE